MKALKSQLQIKWTRRLSNRMNLAKYTGGLMLAIVGLISSALMKWPIQLASAETVALGWSSTGSLNTPRSSHTATLLLDGKVLVAGGSNNVPYQILGTAEVYDPATGKWSVTGRLNVRRYFHTATLLKDGKVMIVGGTADDNDSLNSAELCQG